MLTIREIMNEIEDWAPPGIAWERDNVGLQIGQPEEKTTGVLISLDVTRAIIQEALEKNCNLIITHHPLIFKPLKNLTPKTFSGKLVLDIARNNLNLYSAHTNIDFTIDGVNFALAKKLGLENTEFLYQEGRTLKKIAVFVPPDYVDAVLNAMTGAGAGLIGDYEACSFQTGGTGTFRPLEGTKPFSGKIGEVNRENEIRVEMVTPSWKTGSVIAAMINAHPYDEVAYDIFPNEAIDPKFGAGVIGTLKTAIPPDEFIEHVKKCVNIPYVRWTRGPRNSVERVAVCGGSGSDLLHAALQKNADVFVTADIKYHAFHEANGIIHLVDAGHYETEIFIVEAIYDRLKNKFQNSGTEFFTTQTITNPIMYS